MCTQTIEGWPSAAQIQNGDQVAQPQPWVLRILHVRDQNGRHVQTRPAPLCVGQRPGQSWRLPR